MRSSSQARGRRRRRRNHARGGRRRRRREAREAGGGAGGVEGVHVQDVDVLLVQQVGEVQVFDAQGGGAQLQLLPGIGGTPRTPGASGAQRGHLGGLQAAGVALRFDAALLPEVTALMVQVWRVTHSSLHKLLMTFTEPLPQQ